MGDLPPRTIAGAPVSPLPEERIFSFLRGRAARLAVTAILMTGCGGASSARAPVGYAILDDAGRSVRLIAPARRVVSIVPSMTELIVALGAADRLIARTAFDADPRLMHLPSLGQTLHPSAEVIIALNLDLVIASEGRSGKRLVEQLESMDVPVYIADVQDVAGIYSAARRIGCLLDLVSRADSLVASLRNGLRRVRKRYGLDPRPTVLYVVWHDPPRTAGPGTFIDELITIAGGANVFGDAQAPWPMVSLEEIVRRDPDYVVISRGKSGHSVQPEWLQELPGWRDLSAVREGRLVTVDSDLFNRPGPRVVEAAQTLGRALYSTRGAAPVNAVPGSLDAHGLATAAGRPVDSEGLIDDVHGSRDAC